MVDMSDHAIAENVHDLNQNFGPTLVAFMADVRSRQMPKKWETGECVPRAAAAQRLLLAHEVLVLLLANEDEHVVRSWFIGMNPRLGGLSPAERIRSLDASKVRGAAQAFVEDAVGA